jgi:hypothetical protein
MLTLPGLNRAHTTQLLTTAGPPSGDEPESQYTY